MAMSMYANVLRTSPKQITIHNLIPSSQHADTVIRQHTNT